MQNINYFIHLLSWSRNTILGFLKYIILISLELELFKVIFYMFPMFSYFILSFWLMLDERSSFWLFVDFSIFRSKHLLFKLLFSYFCHILCQVNVSFFVFHPLVSFTSFLSSLMNTVFRFLFNIPIKVYF